ncbi:MAG: tyrosine--tRNA ligase [Runella slithyformis]|nr:MAG: tyrosine--tRNA ligase [Runella slithyformis]TAF00014.1 MAG: tyrosine--tRNA ligase [Runella slithyformis]TAF28280.1 MAG: tyrosine--tRNA ligase [Runella slithyformis]TAF46970.1 MAG: tyrosine--tRNA ligase [Runella slithyformis]TAF83120.1 MAG: tyrosine--tRNA ligase [Runella slithyformis]
MKNFIEELRWRGMLHDMMPGTEKQLQQEITAAYIGFDPTAASLHIGNLATIMLLKHFQLCGHKPVALIGGATGMVGDPSGKSAERAFLSEETLRYNEACIKKQLEKFLDFEASPNAAEIVNNYDWFKGIGFLEFLREAGKYISVNYMSAKDSVKKRLETGISFTEFSYQLLQGYDFYWLYKNKNVRLQMGGSDQWGNITTGTELIRRKENNNDEAAEYRAFALTTPLVTKADGTKFGKSETGNVWLDPTMTSSFQFYQFWLNCTDTDCPRLLRVFTLLAQTDIETLETQHAEAPHLRLMQKALAQEVTTRVHSAAAYEMAVAASEVLFGKGTLDTLRSMDEATFKGVFEGVPQSSVNRTDFETCPSVADLLSVATNHEIYPSKSEARRAIQGNGVSINKTKITDGNSKPNFELLLGRYLLVGKGKKNHLIEVQ